MSPDPGRIAYEARFAHARPREFDPWDSLAPEVQAIWVRVECAVLDAAGSGIHPGQAREAADDPGQPSTVSTAAIVPSVVAGETFVAIQDEHVQLLQRIDRGPFFVPLLERAYVKLIPWNGDTLIPRLVSCGWAGDGAARVARCPHHRCWPSGAGRFRRSEAEGAGREQCRVAFGRSSEQSRPASIRMRKSSPRSSWDRLGRRAGPALPWCWSAGASHGSIRSSVAATGRP